MNKNLWRNKYFVCTEEVWAVLFQPAKKESKDKKVAFLLLFSVTTQRKKYISPSRIKKVTIKTKIQVD